jgi:Ca-activated chloride channel family protein
MLHHWFANPWAFGLLGLTPLLSLLGFFAARRRRRALARLGNLLTLEVLIASRPWRRFLRASALSLGLTLLVVGIAGPQWGRDWSQSVAPGRDLVVVLDVSRSMFAEQPSRLERARAALADLVRALKGHGGHRVALVAFAGRSTVLCPLTHDYDHFAETVAALDAQHLPRDVAATDDEVSGTRIGAGLREAAELLDPRYRGYQDVLLLSDGDDPASDGEWRLPAAEGRAREIPIHTVGLGDPDADSPIPLGDGRTLEHDGKPVRTRLREGPLREIAEMTEGIYIPARTKALPLGKLFREYIEGRPVREDSEDALPLYQQHYAWFLGAALALLAGEMALGGRTRSNRAAVAPPAEAEPEPEWPEVAA